MALDLVSDRQLVILDLVSLNDIKIVTSTSHFNLNDEVTYFDVSTRTYTKKSSENEIKFMNFLLPEKAKFIPYVI